MADHHVTLREIIQVPDDAEIHIAPTGRAVGFRLPDGRMVKPWIVWEIEEGDANRNLSHDELQALGFEPADDLEREIEEAE